MFWQNGANNILSKFIEILSKSGGYLDLAVLSKPTVMFDRTILVFDRNPVQS